MKVTGSNIQLSSGDAYDPMQEFGENGLAGNYPTDIFKSGSDLVIQWKDGTTSSISLVIIAQYIKQLDISANKKTLTKTFGDDSTEDLELGNVIKSLTFSDTSIIYTKLDDTQVSVNLSELVTFNLTSDKFTYINSEGFLKASSVGISNVLLKRNASTQQIDSNLYFKGSATFDDILLNDQFNDSPTLPSVKYITNNYLSAGNDENTILLKKGVINLVKSIDTSGGSVDIDGNPDSLVYINSEGNGLDASSISYKNLLQSTSSTNQATSGYDVFTFDDVGVAITGNYDSDEESASGGYLSLLNKLKVKFIKNSATDSYPQNLSLMTETAIKSVVAQAQLSGNNYLTPVVNIVTSEPSSPGTGDSYIYNESTDDTWSGTTISAGAIATWTGSVWISRDSNLGDVSLNQNNGHYYKYSLRTDIAAYTWVDIGTLGIDSHDTASDVRESDGSITGDPSTMFHLDSAETTLLLYGGTVVDQHYHALVSTDRPGMVPQLPSTSSKEFFMDDGSFSPVQLPEETNELDLLGTSTKNKYLSQETVYAQRSGKQFKYVFSFDSEDQYQIKMVMPSREYLVTAHVSNSYGEVTSFVISNKNISEGSTKAKIYLDEGFDGGKSCMKFGYDGNGDNIYIDSTDVNKMNPVFHDRYGYAEVFVTMYVYYYTVPSPADITVTADTTNFTENFSEADTNLLGANNTWQGINTFNEEVQFSNSLSATGSSVMNILSASIVKLVGLSDGDKLVYDATNGIIKDPKENQSQLSITGTSPTFDIDVDILTGKTKYVTIPGSIASDDTISLNYLNLSDGDEVIIKLIDNSGSEWILATPSTNNIIVGKASTDYTVGGTVVGDQYLIGIKKINGTTQTIITKSKDGS